MEIEDQGAPTKTEISLKDRIRIVSLKSQGLTGAEVGDIVGHSKSACNSIFKRWNDIGSVEDLTRSGRPKKLNEEETEMVIESTKANPEMTLEEIIEDSQVDISKTTGWRTLISNNFCCRTAAEKWELDDVHRGNRLAWAKDKIKHSDVYWENIIFTDESIISHNPNKQMPWLHKDEEVPPIQRDHWQDSVMIWGAIGFEGKFILEVLEGTMDSGVYLDILKRRLLRNFPTLHPDRAQSKGVDPLIYQHDGATSHTALAVKAYFDQRDIQVLDWPAKSPDINLIEPVWARLKKGLKRSYNSRKELIEDIMESKKSTTSHFIKSLYSSMKRRLQAIIDANGGPTKY